MTNHFESVEQAIAVLKDTSQDELVRNDAIKYLQEDGSPEAIDALISAMTDDDLGVRWAAGDALAKLGSRAAPAFRLPGQGVSQCRADVLHHAPCHSARG